MTQTSIEYPQWVEHQPVASIGTGGPIEFLLPGSGDDYLDLANTYLFVRARVLKGDGGRLPAAAPVGPVNNWMHSLFSQFDVSLNRTLVTPSTNTYAYRAYIETLLSHGAAKNSQLTSALWYKDTAGHMDATDNENEGLLKRKDYTTGSRIVDMMGRLHVDLFFQDRYLLNGVDVKIRLVQSKNAFALMAGGDNPDYKISIDEAVLFARKAKLNPAVQMGHVKALEKGTAKYPLRRVHCKGKMFQDEGNDITRQDFAEGYTLFAFDITPDCCDGPHFNFEHKGNLRVEMHFDEPLEQTVNVVVYGEFESVLEIDRNRNVVYDY
ncbi:hypothetical protein NP493_3668g00015 [Ridgeia piscesae]|uniref:Uncharacterized protein n=1 Tax=Ridgeia piscesae TaxID=27915 RepID=A0AAD9J4B7_RIDPI|nr:hypothetical protein NP493_3668g00015 [Ridgeia piscesae]